MPDAGAQGHVPLSSLGMSPSPTSAGVGDGWLPEGEIRRSSQNRRMGTGNRPRAGKTQPPPKTHTKPEAHHSRCTLYPSPSILQLLSPSVWASYPGRLVTMGHHLYPLCLCTDWESLCFLQTCRTKPSSLPRTPKLSLWETTFSVSFCMARSPLSFSPWACTTLQWTISWWFESRSLLGAGLGSQGKGCAL